MIAPIKIWTDDHTQLVQYLMDQMLLPYNDITRMQITSAYMAGYEKQSDGGTFIGQLEFQEFLIKAPYFVWHDYSYFLGMKNPYLPSGIKTEIEARRWDDGSLDIAMKKFNHPVLAPISWIGVRFGAQAAWDAHRRAGHPDNAKYDLNGMLTFEAIKENAT